MLDVSPGGGRPLIWFAAELHHNEAEEKDQREAGAGLAEPHAMTDEKRLFVRFTEREVGDADIGNVLMSCLVRDSGPIDEA